MPYSIRFKKPYEGENFLDEIDTELTLDLIEEALNGLKSKEAHDADARKVLSVGGFQAEQAQLRGTLEGGEYGYATTIRDVTARKKSP